jgi:hypothetical protein
MTEWLAIAPTLSTRGADPDTAAERLAELAAAPLGLDLIYVVPVEQVRVYEVGVYPVPIRALPVVQPPARPRHPTT